MKTEALPAMAAALRQAESLLITAGAGMGVDSGLPDFRGPEGFWRAYPPMRALNLSFEELADPRWFEEDPSLAWGFYGHRLQLYRDTLPHEGFQILLRLASQRPSFVFTSNVDGQFQRAGFREDQICEIHGSIHWLQSLSGRDGAIWSAEETQVEVDLERFRAIGPLPRDPDGGLARPNILMFGDWGFQSSRVEAQQRRLQTWLDGQQLSRMLVIELGAGTRIPTVRSLGEQVARAGATLLRINPREAWVPEGAIALEAGALEGLEALVTSQR